MNPSFSSCFFRSEPKKARRAYDKSIVDIMENWYGTNLLIPYPTPSDKRRIAEETKLTYQEVSFWFSNRRKKDRKQFASGHR